MHGSCLSWTFSLPAPPDCTRRLLRCQLKIFMFDCGERLSCFLKVHMNQKISSMIVCSPWMNWRNLKSISKLCALVWVVVELRHNYIGMCSKAGRFIFLLKMYTMDVLCKSKVVHFNTKVCVPFFFLPVFPTIAFPAMLNMHCEHGLLQNSIPHYGSHPIYFFNGFIVFGEVASHN